MNAGNLGASIGMAGLGAFAALIFAFLPPVPFGVFDRQETTSIAAFAAVGLCALALALAPHRPRARAWRAPLFLPFAALGIWSIASAPLAEFPWESLSEQTRSGQGALVMLGFAATAGALAAFAGPRTRKVLALVLVAGALAAALQQAIGPGVWRPWRVPALLAYLGLAAFVGLAVVRPLGRASLPVGLAVLVVTLAPSENRSTIGLTVLLGVPAYFAARQALARGWARQMRIAGAVLVVALTPLATATIWILGANGIGASIVSRARIYDVMFAAFLDRPWTLVLGNGWGASLEAFYRHIAAGADRLYGTSWDMAVREFPSAHNLAFEFWFAAGLPGLIVGMALPALAIWRARTRDLPVAIAFAAVMAASATFWHLENYAWGAVFVAFAMLARRPWRFVPPASGAMWRTGAFASALALAGTAAWLFDFGARARAALVAEPPAACFADFPADSGRGEFVFRTVLNRFADAGDTARLQAGLCALERRFADRPTLHLAAAGVEYFGLTLTNPALRHLPAERWPVYLDALLALAPLRTDLAAPYFAALILAEDWPAMRARADAMLARAPDDTVALWFSGFARLRETDPAARRAGLERMRRALDLGFERVVELPAETIRAVREAR